MDKSCINRNIESAEMTHARIEILMESKEADIIIRSLTPETSGSPRSDVNISRSKKGLILDVSADDTSALRAALNSYLRWITVAQNVKNIKK